jgi:hypothetical protein
MNIAKQAQRLHELAFQIFVGLAFPQISRHLRCDRVAQTRAETALKRADFEYQKMVDEFVRRNQHKI